MVSGLVASTNGSGAASGQYAKGLEPLNPPKDSEMEPSLDMAKVRSAIGGGEWF